MQIANSKVVTIDYTLTDDRGTVLDKSDDGTFAYLHGAANIIPGLEQALEGKQAGDQVNVKVAPEQGYGQRDDSLIQNVPKSAFADAEPQPGMQFHAQAENGQMIVVTVTDVQNEQVTIDGNHPLAGVSLNFDVNVREVREATGEEMEHGHVHGPEGHEH